MFIVKHNEVLSVNNFVDDLNSHRWAALSLDIGSHLDRFVTISLRLSLFDILQPKPLLLQ